MKRTKLLPAGFLALALAGTGALIATAQTAPAQPDRPAASGEVHRADFRGDKDRRGHRMRGHHWKRGGFAGPFGGGEMFRTLFETIDADGDGSVTMAEIDAYRSARVAEADASGDGALSIEEFDTLYREFTRTRMVRAFQKFDVNGDGVISAEEMETPIARMFERMDRDGDGALTLQRPNASAPAAPGADTQTDN